MKYFEIINAVKNHKTRSAWNTGVKAYALELLEDISYAYEPDDDFTGCPADEKNLLNGARSWGEYSWGGASLIYECEIAERLCSPSELRKCKGGQLKPNRFESSWLDTQARALYQASNLIIRIARENR